MEKITVGSNHSDVATATVLSIKNILGLGLGLWPHSGNKAYGMNYRRLENIATHSLVVDDTVLDTV